MRFTLVLLYLGAIVAANLVVSWYGPGAVILNAFLFIGLDMTMRDRLHELWQGHMLWQRMIILIVAGGLLSLLLGGSGRVAVASCMAFVLAGLADTHTYTTLQHRCWFYRTNGSNLVAAAVDSLCFPLLAFGWPPLWAVVVGQFAAKVLGGVVWSLALRGRVPQLQEEVAQ